LNQGRGVTASLGAIASSLASLACCFPLGATAAAGLAGASAFAQALRPWMLSLSVALLAAGFWQQRQARKCGLRRSSANDALLWIAFVVVAAMILFPQEIAGLVADHFYKGRRG
jgi:hypothetical protein